MKRILYAFLLFFVCNVVLAQQLNEATVLDSITQKPLAGATIIIGKEKMITNKVGSFSFSCKAGLQMSISFVGYATSFPIINNCGEKVVFYLKPNTTILETVEVSAISGINKGILYQPMSITKLSNTELKRGNGLFLDDAIITNVPGVSMNRRSVGGGQQFNIRGYGNGARGTRGISSNFDGQGYKVYVNGIPLTDAEGITTMDDIDFGSVENVEVTKGPAGTLNGLAIAGAVHLTMTKPEKGKTSVSQQMMVGNYGLKRFTTSFQTGGEKSSLMVNYGKQHSDGFTLHNQSNKEFVNVVANFQPNEKQTINTYFGYSNSKDERAGELTLTQFDTEDYSGNPEYIKRNGHSNVVTFRAGINHQYEFNKHFSNTTTVFGTGFASNASSAAGWTDKSTINYGIRSTFQTRFNLSDNITLNGVTGIEWQNQIAQTIGYSMKKDPFDTASTWVLGVNPYWVINAASSNVYTVANTKSLFSEWTLNLPEEFSITAGIGSSTQGLLLNDRFNTALTTKPSNFDTTYKNMVSPHIAINKVFNKHFSIFASYSKGYKAPVSSYFYITTPAVTTPATPATGSLNRLLHPEIGSQFEIGHRGQLDNNKLSYELIYFNTVFSNKKTAISVQSPASATTTLYTYMVNGGKQIHKGIEALVKYTVYSSDKKFVRLLRPFVNVTRSNFVYGDNFKIQKSVTLTEDYSNKAVAGISKYIVNLGADVSFCGGFYANVTYNYRDKMPITSMNDFYTASYNLLNGKLGMQKSIGKHWMLDASFGVNNITSTKYALMVFANQLPDAYVPAARNANYFGNLQMKYGF